MTAVDLDRCMLRFTDLGIEVPYWTSYSFHTDFLTPSDGFTFTIGDSDIPTALKGHAKEGQRVSIAIGDVTIMTGVINEVHAEASRGSGTVFTFSGQDVLGDAIYSIIDPAQVFKPTQSLATIIKAVMEPFGFTKDPIVDNDANRNLITGNRYGYKVYPASKAKHSRRGRSKSKAGQAIASQLAYQSKPHPHEGAYAFVERLANRQGLHVMASGDGTTLIVCKPDFDQDPTFSIIRNQSIDGGAQNNVLGGHVNRSRVHQPSVIVAAATGGGGDFSRSSNKVIAINELISRLPDGSLTPAVAAIIAKYPKAYLMNDSDFDGPVSIHAYNPYLNPRPLYLFDSEARDVEQLKNFVRRELAERQKTSLSCTYEVEGHSQNGTVWATDCIVQVQDDVAELYEPMWIQSVAFSKSRSGGTKSSIQCIRPYTLNY